MPETLCGGRLSVDQVQRLIRIDGHPIGITEMEYRVLELLAFARNNVVTRAMLLKHLYRRVRRPAAAQDHRRVHLQAAQEAEECVRRGGVHRDDPAARLDPARHRREKRGLASPLREGPDSRFVSRSRLPRDDASPARSFRARQAPLPYAEAVSRLASVRHALRLVEPFGGGPASDLDDDDAIAAAWDGAGEARQRAVRPPLGADGRRPPLPESKRC